MTTVTAGSAGSYTFTAVQRVSVTLSGTQRANIEIRRLGAIVYGTRLASSCTIGPFGIGDVMSLTAEGSDVTYQVAGDPVPSGFTSSVVRTRGIGRTTYPDAVGGELLYWPMLEKSGATITDAASGQIAQYGGSSTGRFEPWSGCNFNGTNQRLAATNGTAAGFIASAMAACDLTTLKTRLDMIHVWGVYGHPTSISADGTIFGWGASQHAKGGWSLGMAATSMKPYFSHCPKGGTNVQTIFPMTGLKGVNSANTMTAFCLQIMSASVAGNLELQMVSLPITDEGGDGQSINSSRIVAEIPSGTAAASRDVVAPITIGAWPTTGATTYGAFSQAGTGLLCLGVHRRPFDPGAIMRVARSLRENPKAFPEGAKA